MRRPKMTMPVMLGVGDDPVFEVGKVTARTPGGILWSLAGLLVVAAAVIAFKQVTDWIFGERPEPPDV